MPIIRDLALSDLIGEEFAFRRFIEVELGYDRPGTIEFLLTQKSLMLTISFQDKFWSKLDYSDRLTLSTWETAKLDDEFSDLIEPTWRALRAHPPRAARELRYSLICLGKVTESEQELESSMAKAIFADIARVREKIAERLLEWQPRVERSAPVRASVEDDEIPF